MEEIRSASLDAGTQLASTTAMKGRRGLSRLLIAGFFVAVVAAACGGGGGGISTIPGASPTNAPATVAPTNGPVPTASANVAVVPIPGSSTANLVAVSPVGEQAVNPASSTASFTVASSGTSFVGVVDVTRTFGWTAVSPGWFSLAGAQIGPLSTAVQMVFMTPGVYTADVDQQRIELAALAVLPSIASLASALNSNASQSDPFSSSAVKTAYQQAVTDGLRSVSALSRSNRLRARVFPTSSGASRGTTDGRRSSSTTVGTLNGPNATFVISDNNAGSVLFQPQWQSSIGGAGQGLYWVGAIYKVDASAYSSAAALTSALQQDQWLQVNLAQSAPIGYVLLPPQPNFWGFFKFQDYIVGALFKAVAPSDDHPASIFQVSSTTDAVYVAHLYTCGLGGTNPVNSVKDFGLIIGWSGAGRLVGKACILNGISIGIDILDGFANGADLRGVLPDGDLVTIATGMLQSNFELSLSRSPTDVEASLASTGLSFVQLALKTAATHAKSPAAIGFWKIVGKIADIGAVISDAGDIGNKIGSGLLNEPWQGSYAIVGDPWHSQPPPPPGTPAVTSISPTSMIVSQTRTLTINGSNFGSGNIVQFYWGQPPRNNQWNTSSATPSITPNQITISMDSGPVPDTIFVRVCNSGGSCSSGSQSVTVTAAPVTPTVTSISPTTMSVNQTQTLTINGSNFGADNVVQFYWGQPPRNNQWNASNATPSIAPSQITISMDSGPVADTIFVRVCNSAGNCSSGSQSVTVTSSPLTPNVTSISPTTMSVNQTQTLTINGSNFGTGNIVQFYWGQPPRNNQWNTSNATPTITPNQITVSMDSGSVPDTILVRVCNSSGSCSSGSQSVTVTGPLTPNVTSISPTTMSVNQTQTLTINGSNFGTGNVVQFYWGQPPRNNQWNTSNATPSITSNQITVNMDSGPVPDTIFVRVCNSNGICSSGSQSVTVTGSPTPSVTSISPTSMTVNQTQTLTINGSNFGSGNIVQFYWGQPPRNNQWNTSNATPSITSNQITVNMDAGPVPDTIFVRVCNSSGSCSSGSQSVTVTGSPTPSVTSISPTSMMVNQTQTLTINGSNFGSGNIVQFYWGQPPRNNQWNTSNATPSITVNQITVSMDAGPVPDTIFVRVCNSSGSCSSGSQSVTVTGQPAPNVTSISPTTMVVNQTRTLTINGSNFGSGNIVQFYWGQPPRNNQWNTSNASPSITANQITVSMDSGPVPDTIYVRVCNSSGVCSGGGQSVSVTR
jgi:hypothetical protein